MKLLGTCSLLGNEGEKIEGLKGSLQCHRGSGESCWMAAAQEGFCSDCSLIKVLHCGIDTKGSALLNNEVTAV